MASPVFSRLLLSLVLCALFAAAAPAGGNPSGLPLPRFVSLRSDEVRMRTGPSVRYPVEWLYQRQDLPVEVIAEFDTWRKVRDWQGSEGWIHQSLLSGERSFIVLGGMRDMRAAATADAPVVARLEPGVIGRILECASGNAWCRLETGGHQGWLPRDAFWGVYPSETIE